MCTKTTFCAEAQFWRRLYLAARAAILCLQSNRPHMADEFIREARINEPEIDVINAGDAARE